MGDWAHLFLGDGVSAIQSSLIRYPSVRLCSGGELFFYITKRKHLTEAQAALVMRQAFYALNYLHTNRICHR